MPRGDRTGPMGMGPMTGSGMGYCTGYSVAGYARAGFAMGCGRGFRRMCYMTGVPGWARYGTYPNWPYAYQSIAPEENEKEVLKNQADFLEKQLEAIRKQLKDFEQAE